MSRNSLYQVKPRFRGSSWKFLVDQEMQDVATEAMSELGVELSKLLLKSGFSEAELGAVVGSSKVTLATESWGAGEMGDGTPS